MELSAPGYSGFQRRSNPDLHFTRGIFTSPRRISTPLLSVSSKTSEIQSTRFHTVSDYSAPPEHTFPISEPLDLRTNRQRHDSLHSGNVDDTIKTVSEHSPQSSPVSRSPAEVVCVKFCECFTGKHQVGELCACYCNESPVYIPRSKLIPLTEKRDTDTTLAPHQMCDQRSPSLNFSSFDSSPPRLVIDFQSSASDTENSSPAKSNEPASKDNAASNAVIVLSRSQEARRAFEFESDEDLKSLGTFSSFRLNTDRSETHALSDTLTKQDPHPGIKSDDLSPTKKSSGESNTPSSSDVDITHLSSPSGENIANISDPKTEVDQAHDTQDYNADISATQLADSQLSLTQVENVPLSTWFVKQELNKRPSPLKMKLCKTFTITGGVVKENQPNQGTVSACCNKTIAQPFVQSKSTEAGGSSCPNVFLRPVASAANLNITQRFVEGRSICEASTIFSASPTSPSATAMSSCVSYPATPDITFNSPKITRVYSLQATPNRNDHVLLGGRISSTPYVRGPVSMKEALKVAKDSEQTSLRKAMFKKKITAQGSDSILNLGFTSTLDIDPKDNVQADNKHKDEAGIFKKPKRSKKVSLLKSLKQRLSCHSNMSVISNQDKTMRQEPLCSDRVKKALEPLTANSNRFNAPSLPFKHIPLCGGTATTSTATMAYAAIPKTEQFGRPSQTYQRRSAAMKSTSTSDSLPPRNLFSSNESVATVTSSLNHLIAPIDLSSSSKVHRSTEACGIHDSRVPKYSADDLRSKQSTVSSNPYQNNSEKLTTSTPVEISPFKVPKVPPSRRTPVSHRQGCSVAASSRPGSGRGTSLSNLSRNEGGGTTGNDSSLSESNDVMTWPTQQSLDIKMVRERETYTL